MSEASTPRGLRAGGLSAEKCGQHNTGVGE